MTSRQRCRLCRYLAQLYAKYCCRPVVLRVPTSLTLTTDAAPEATGTPTEAAT
jgi:hypothetical protein